SEKTQRPRKPSNCGSRWPWYCAEPSKSGAPASAIISTVRAKEANTNANFASTDKRVERVRAAARRSNGFGWLDDRRTFARGAKPFSGRPRGGAAEDARAAPRAAAKRKEEKCRIARSSVFWVRPAWSGNVASSSG